MSTDTYSFFGGVISTRLIKLYLWLMHGKTIIVSKASDLEVLARAREHRPLLRRQMVYFGSILAVVVSFRI